jgi:hypothetical protein
LVSARLRATTSGLCAQIDELEELGEERAERQGEVAEERFEAEIDRLEEQLDAREDEYCLRCILRRVFRSIRRRWRLLAGNPCAAWTLDHVAGVAARAVTPLPPWAESLGSGERRLEFALKKVLLALLFVVPGTGLLLIAAGHDWLPLHVTAHVLFLVVIALHVGLVLKHTVVYRRAHLRRML